MSSLNVGDRVRINSETATPEWRGEEGEVVRIEGQLAIVKTDNILRGTLERGFVRMKKTKLDFVEEKEDRIKGLFIKEF